MRPLTKLLQSLLMRIISLSASAYVNLNPNPMRIVVTTEERIPKPDPEPPEDAPSATDPVYIQWLDELYHSSPSSEDARD